MKVTYSPSNLVCTKQIDFEIRDNKIYNVEFTRGCNGNLKAIAKLIEGMDVDRVISLLEGNTCGVRPTSCTDQLVLAIREELERVNG